MISYIIFILILGITGAIVSKFFIYRKELKLIKKLETEKKYRLFKSFKIILVKVKIANENFKKLTNFKVGYFSRHNIVEWEKDNKLLINNLIFNKSFRNIGLQIFEENEIELFVNVKNNLEFL